MIYSTSDCLRKECACVQRELFCTHGVIRITAGGSKDEVEAMMNETNFFALLQQMEGNTLDFKATGYPLAKKDEEKTADFIKDVICMANTPRTEVSYIILGVDKHPDGTYDLLGVDSHPDEELLQSQFTDKVRPIPDFTYECIAYQGKSFGMIKIMPRRVGPCLLLKDFPEDVMGRTRTILRRSQIYFRRGSKNDVATSAEDITHIIQWAEASDIEEPSPSEPAWEEFLRATSSFESSRYYLLLVPPLALAGSDYATIIGKFPWVQIIDFDPNSDVTGFQKVIGPTLENHRSVHRVVYADRPTLLPDRATYWFYARGLTGREETLSSDSWRIWVSKYGNEVKEQLRRLAAAINPAPLTCVALWYNAVPLNSHLRSFLTDILSTFQETVNFTIATDQPADLLALVDDYGANLIDIPLHQLCSGLHSIQPGTPVLGQEECILPSSSGTPFLLDVKTRQWMEEELEFVNLSAGVVPTATRLEVLAGREFLRGAEIDWYELNLQVDVVRDKTRQIERELEHALDRKRAVRLNIYHDPGAGGTTIARRILWNMHRSYPCVILHHYTSHETAERLFRLASETGLPVLVLIDGAEIAERQVEELYNYLKSRLVAVVLLQTLRRVEQQSEGRRATHLPAQLSSIEAQRFVEAFSRQEPYKRRQLETLARTRDERTCTAFYFGLETFGKDFLGVEPYVRTRLADLTMQQKRILTFLAFAHHYAQLPLPAQAFAELLSFPKNRVLKLSLVLPPSACELLVEVHEEEWRTTHNVIAQEIIEQVLWPSSLDRRPWRQNLSSWAKNFAQFCRGESAIASERMREIADRVFIYRDNADLLGTERSVSRTFARLIDDIPSPTGKVELLRHVAELYPEEAHFWAHLGRLYSVELKDFKQSLIYIERAIELQRSDNVLYHMKGMALRYQIDELIRQHVDIEQIVPYVKQACESFEQARLLAPDDPYGYISEVQMLARVLDFVGSKSGGGIQSYWSLPTADVFLRDSLERAETLLEQVRRNREGEGASSFEEECRGRLDLLYGQHDQALQIWDNLLHRRDVYSPPLRRQIVWTYLARRDRLWDALEPREVERIVALLESNLQEEPSSDQNLRLWVQAVRRLKQPPSVEAVIERVSYWKVNAATLDPTYYLYVFNVLQVLEGSVWAREEAKRYIEECKYAARLRRNRTKSLEWLGNGKGITKLVYHSELGKWLTDKEFWEKTQRLSRVEGRIARIDTPQSGQIEIEGGLHAFFAPGRGGYQSGYSENQRVAFYLGFSYDGLRAWEVKNI